MKKGKIEINITQYKNDYLCRAAIKASYDMFIAAIPEMVARFELSLSQDMQADFRIEFINALNNARARFLSYENE